MKIDNIIWGPISYRARFHSMNTFKNMVFPFPVMAANYGMVAFIVALPAMVVLYRWFL